MPSRRFQMQLSEPDQVMLEQLQRKLSKGAPNPVQIPTCALMRSALEFYHSMVVVYQPPWIKPEAK